MYLEWAPADVFGSDAGEDATPSAERTSTSTQPQAAHASDTAGAPSQRAPLTAEQQQSGPSDANASASANEKAQGSTLFVKNLAFSTTEEQLRDALARLADDVRAVHIPQVLAGAAVSEKGAALNEGKKRQQQQQQLRSAGYAFVELGGRESAARLVKEAQHVSVDGHQLELQVARAQAHANTGSAQRAPSEPKAAPASSKLLVRNVPFQAKQRELRQLFRWDASVAVICSALSTRSTVGGKNTVVYEECTCMCPCACSAFGELKSVRMPKKQDAQAGTNSHRGFAFVDFATIADAKVRYHLHSYLYISILLRSFTLSRYV